MESGLDVRTARRVLTHKQLKSKQNDQDKNNAISFDFIQKILIWMCACFSVCLFILFTEFIV